MSSVSSLEERLLPLFSEAQVLFSNDFPSFKFNVWSSAVGSKTQYQGHNLGLECIFPDAADHEADCVAVSVGTMHLTTEPRICEACVEWGAGEHPGPQVELIPIPLPLLPEAIEDVASKVPTLLAVFRLALEGWLQRRSQPTL